MQDGTKRALQDSVPVFFSYFSLGVVYGFIFVQLLGSWQLATVSSITVFAGAVQFLAMGVFAEQGPLPGMLVAATFVALRNSFYGLSLLHDYDEGSRWRRLYLMFGLVDATYSIITTRPTEDRKATSSYAFTLTWIIHFYWVAGTALGGYYSDSLADLLGDSVNPSSLEFILTAFYVILTYEQWRKIRDLRPLILAAFCGVTAMFLIPHYMLLIAISTTTLLLLWGNHRKATT